METTAYPLRPAGLLAGAYIYAMNLLASKLAGAVIALMAAVGVAGTLVTFF